MLKSVDCFINTSEFEGFGNIFIESLAYCKNTLAYRSTGGATELLSSSSAFLVKDGDEEKIAEKLFEILSLQKNNIGRDENYIKNFSKKNISKIYLENIRELYEKNFIYL